MNPLSEQGFRNKYTQKATVSSLLPLLFAEDASKISQNQNRDKLVLVFKKKKSK